LPDITAPPATAKSTTTANGTTEDSSGGVSVAAEPEPSNSSEPPPTPSKAPNQKKVEEIESSMSQSIAVLGISLVAMGEDIGSSMSLRLFGHLVGLFIKTFAY
jgi:heme-binding NEAT domain protein